MPHLFSPLLLKSIELKNRIVVSPMCEYSSEDGFANDWHLVHLGSRAVGGAGLVFTEATAISPEGRITYADLGLWKNEHIPKLKEITDFILRQGSIPGIQLAHAGRKASHEPPWKGGNQISDHNNHGWKAVSPSSIPFNPDHLAPLQLDLEGIRKIIGDFKTAAQRALEAGFQVLEIHAAHGYLVHQFLSPLSNYRKDSYGGDFEHRIKILLNIIDAVKTVWPQELPLFVRISATEWTEGGWNIDDSIALSKILLEKGVDLIDCSSGGNIHDAAIKVGPGYQIPFARAIRKEVSIKTGAVGLITEAEQANLIIWEEEADLIFMARELLRDPYFPLRAAHLLSQEIPWPVQYERARFRK